MVSNIDLQGSSYPNSFSRGLFFPGGSTTSIFFLNLSLLLLFLLNSYQFQWYPKKNSNISIISHKSPDKSAEFQHKFHSVPINPSFLTSLRRFFPKRQDFRSSVSRAREAAAIWQELGYRMEDGFVFSRMSWHMIFRYGSIPIDTILVGWTSIYQLFWCSPGG